MSPAPVKVLAKTLAAGGVFQGYNSGLGPYPECWFMAKSSIPKARILGTRTNSYRGDFHDD
jgi:hypothetical protein